MRYVRKLTDGPIGVGTRYQMEFIPRIPMVVECVRFDRPSSWVVAGDTIGTHVTLCGHVTSKADGAHLVLRTEFQASGLIGIALPRLGRRMQRELQRDIVTIKSILEAVDTSGIGPAEARSFGSNLGRPAEPIVIGRGALANGDPG